jgi:hypothetical protein
MTTEQVVLMDVGDVQALRVTCGNCRTAIVFRLDETIHLPSKCPSCSHGWTPSQVGDPAFTRLVVALKEWARVDQDRQPFAVRLEIPQGD